MRSFFFTGNNEMRTLIFVLAFAGLITAQSKIFKDPENNLLLLQNGKMKITLLYLSCTGGKQEDIDTARFVADSLGWNIAVCSNSKNHRNPELNEQDILNLVEELIEYPQVDPYKIVIYGFSGQGAQALATALKFPQKFGGIITQCAHQGLLSKPDWQGAAGMPVLLITRQQDWNRESNEEMAQTFEKSGLQVKLLITTGEHKIGDAKELLENCKMMKMMLK